MTNADADQPSFEGGQVAPVPASPKLVSLSSGYVPKQHETYLRHLKDAVKAPKNFNIALSGRYGTGKSSILDQFAALNTKTTMRIAISTLGPDTDGKGITNRIQKELVNSCCTRQHPGSPVSRGSTASSRCPGRARRSRPPSRSRSWVRSWRRSGGCRMSSGRDLVTPWASGCWRGRGSRCSPSWC